MTSFSSLSILIIDQTEKWVRILFYILKNKFQNANVFGEKYDNDFMTRKYMRIKIFFKCLIFKCKNSQKYQKKS